MGNTVVNLSCPGCGARVNTGHKECIQCGGVIIFSTFNSVVNMPVPMLKQYAGEYKNAIDENPENVELNLSIAHCYLKLKLFDNALIAYEKAIEHAFDNSEVYFYAAVCLLKGNKAFLAQRATIDKIEKYINAALIIEPKGVYYYFWAYIKHDYYHRKFFNTHPNYQEVLQLAHENSLSDFDIDQLFSLLSVPKPEVL